MVAFYLVNYGHVVTANGHREWSLREESHLRPPPCRGGALLLSYAVLRYPRKESNLRLRCVKPLLSR